MTSVDFIRVCIDLDNSVGAEHTSSLQTWQAVEWLVRPSGTVLPRLTLSSCAVDRAETACVGVVGKVSGCGTPGATNAVPARVTVIRRSAQPWRATVFAWVTRCAVICDLFAWFGWKRDVTSYKHLRLKL